MLAPLWDLGRPKLLQDDIASMSRLGDDVNCGRHTRTPSLLLQPSIFPSFALVDLRQPSPPSNGSFQLKKPAKTLVEGEGEDGERPHLGGSSSGTTEYMRQTADKTFSSAIYEPQKRTGQSTSK